MAIAALGASMLAGVGPFDCLLRGFIAYWIGKLLTASWYIFFTIRVEKSDDQQPQPVEQRAVDEKIAA